MYSYALEGKGDFDCKLHPLNCKLHWPKGAGASPRVTPARCLFLLFDNPIFASLSSFLLRTSVPVSVLAGS